MAPSDRRKRQEQLAALSPDELLSEWRAKKNDVLGVLGPNDEIDLNKSLPGSRAQIEALAAKYALSEASLVSFLKATEYAIDDYYIYWMRNAQSIRDGYCSKAKAEKFARTIRSAIQQMNDAGLMARLQFGADQMWPGEIFHTRQYSMLPVEEPDAFIKSPAAFRLAVTWFEAIANVACFDASDSPRISSSDAKAAAEVLLSFYLEKIDPSARFNKNENLLWDDEYDINESPKSAFDFVFYSLRVVDPTVRANHLKDFVLLLNWDAFARRMPIYQPGTSRFEQRVRVLNENKALIEAFNRSKARDA